MSPSGSETVLWRETNPRFCAASQHLEHLSNCSIRFQRTPCVCKGIWAWELTCLWGRTDCQLIQSRCEETCEDAVWSVWLTFRTAALRRWNTWVFLFPMSLFPPMLRCFIFHVVTETMLFLHMLSRSTGTLLDSVLTLKVSIFLGNFRLIDLA